MNQTKGKRPHLLQVVIILAIILGLGSIIYVPKLLQNTPPQTRILQSTPECELTQSFCEARDNGGAISLRINNQAISAATPLTFEVKLENIAADQVMLDLKGRDMFMGLNQVMLSKVAGQDDLWQGEVVLGVCTTGKMTWVTSVITEHQGRLTQADFFFDAQ